jgi:leucyl/phenylalanyl-tRNA--protein transferase
MSRTAMAMLSSLGYQNPAHGGSKLSIVIDPALLVRAYRVGVFPMAMEDGEIGWFSPDPRAVLPIEDFLVPARLARRIRQGTFDIVVDRDFEAVMRACAERSAGTWISEDIVQSYLALHRLGLAHSVEARREGRLVGGLYGVQLGGAFFGESMFHVERDASKVALAWLADRLHRRGFALLDTQWATPHLVQFGVVEIPRSRYLRLLKQAVARECVFP